MSSLAAAMTSRSWVEKTALEMADAVIAVSESDRRQIVNRFQVAKNSLQVIHNGIDTRQYRPVTTISALEKYGIDPSTAHMFYSLAGSAARKAYRSLYLGLPAPQTGDPGGHLCLGARHLRLRPGNKKIRGNLCKRNVTNVIWLQEMVTRPEAIELYSHAAVFCCPSIYEPFGIINLEAMACETPVVASCVGGIKDVVVQGETGFLVDVDPVASDNSEPADPKKFAMALAARMNELVADEKLRHDMGRKGRERVVAKFGWGAVAEKVFNVYAAVTDKE